MLEHTGKIRVRDRETGLYLVAPVSGWKHLCAPAWTDIPEASFRFNNAQAMTQRCYLKWNCNITAVQTA